MTLSVLISILKQMKISHGDVEVKLEAGDRAWTSDIQGIYHEKQGEDSVIILTEQS